MGATPHRWAQAASECSRSGLSPALTKRAAAVSGPTPKRASSSGAAASTSFSMRSSSSAISSSSPWIRRANEHSDALWAAITASPERDGRSLAASATSAATAQALQATTQLVGGGDHQMAHLGQRLDPGPSGRALGHDEDPDGLDGPVLGLRDALGPAAEGGPSRLDGVEGIGLATASALGPVGPVDLDHLDVCSAQVTGQARSIRARALHPDLGQRTEALEPGEQRPVAGRVGVEALRSKQCAEWVEGGGDMDVEVGVDTTGHGPRSFYDGHGHPFC